MLKAFTWQDFLLAATLLTLLWWAVVWLMFYRKPGGRLAAVPFGACRKDVDRIELVEDDLMGKPALVDGVQILEPDEFSFGEPVRDLDKVNLLGDVAYVQQEIKSICGILAREDGTKEDFFSLFEMLRMKYPKVGAGATLVGLNAFIREHVPFALSEEELDRLWA